MRHPWRSSSLRISLISLTRYNVKGLRRSSDTDPANVERVTCIVGVADGGQVIIGGDLTIRSDSKVFRAGPYVMGFTTSFRMGQLLRYSLRPLEPGTWDVDRFMSTALIDAVRQCLKDGGYATTKDGGEVGGEFLVGYRHLLYVVYSDYQISRTADLYDAAGCGADLALGALHATVGDEPERRVTKALEAAAHHSAGVCGPFTILRSET
jgi:hypothetical protein